MAYELIVTEHADELLDNLVRHLLAQQKNDQAARHLLDEIENVADANIVNVVGIFHQLENYQRKI